MRKLGSQKRIWIALTLLLSFYNPRKQLMRQINQRKASAKLILILKIKERKVNQRRRKSQESHEGLPGIWNQKGLLELLTPVESSRS